MPSGERLTEFTQTQTFSSFPPSHFSERIDSIIDGLMLDTDIPLQADEVRGKNRISLTEARITREINQYLSEEPEYDDDLALYPIDDSQVEYGVILRRRDSVLEGRNRGESHSIYVLGADRPIRIFPNGVSEDPQIVELILDGVEGMANDANASLRLR